jgi:hypothetical protein
LIAQILKCLSREFDTKLGGSLILLILVIGAEWAIHYLMRTDPKL